MRDHAFTVTGGSVTGARRLVSGKNLRWEIVVSPDSNGDVTIVLPATTDCDGQGAICADGDKKLSNRLERTVSGPGQAERNLRALLGHVAQERTSAASAKATLALYLLDGVKVPKDVKDLIQSM